MVENIFLLESSYITFHLTSIIDTFSLSCTVFRYVTSKYSGFEINLRSLEVN